MFNLKKILGMPKKEAIRNFTNEEMEKLMDVNIFEQIYRPDVTETYITDALRLAQSMETIDDEIKTGHMDKTSVQNETAQLLYEFKLKHSSYFIIR